jgi:hypothetical protein
MPSLTDRLIRLTQELIEINRELEQDIAATSAGAAPEVTAGYAVLNTFKGVVDQTRHLLWPFVIAAHQRSEENLTAIMQGYRMNRIRQMMGSLQEDDEQKPSDTVRLFLAEVERLAHKSQRLN